jgi:hypothetical protein
VPRSSPGSAGLAKPRLRAAKDIAAAGERIHGHARLVYMDGLYPADAFLRLLLNEVEAHSKSASGLPAADVGTVPA